jgi:DNA-binding transcriptional MocR family regulator
MTEMLKSGELERHIEKTLRPAFASRYQSIMKAIEKHLVPLGATLPPTESNIAGGYFLWLTLPESLDADELGGRVEEEENVIIAPGSLFAVWGEEKAIDLKSELRICFAWEDEKLLQESIERIAQVVRKMLKDLRSGETSATSANWCKAGQVNASLYS